MDELYQRNSISMAASNAYMLYCHLEEWLLNGKSVCYDYYTKTLLDSLAIELKRIEDQQNEGRPENE